MQIVCFHHMFQPKNDGSGIWPMMFTEQMRTYEESGLSAVAPVKMGVIGKQSDRDKLREFALQYPFLEIIAEHDISENDDNLYEGATLEPLWRWCVSHHAAGGERACVYYSHGKASVTMNKCTNLHRLYMEEFLLRRWREPYELIRSGDATIAGVEWRNNGWWHFSGNFWVGASDYIAKLPNPRTDCDVPGNFYVDNSRVKMEMWIGSGVTQGLHPTVAVLHDSGIADWYRGAIETAAYKDKPTTPRLIKY